MASWLAVYGGVLCPQTASCRLPRIASTQRGAYLLGGTLLDQALEGKPPKPLEGQE